MISGVADAEGEAAVRSGAPDPLSATAGRNPVTEGVQAALLRAKRREDLNAFVTLDGTRALRRAREMDRRHADRSAGPLQGMPLVIKDNIAVAGLPNTACTPALRTFVPEVSASACSRLEAAGAVILGKTGMHELAFGSTCINPVYGTIRNPWDPKRIPGGSSGGTAAAIASGIVAAGLGTDTIGSTRMPASLCGIVGFRPTVGRYPSDGVVPLSHTRDTIGPMARSVSDIILLDMVLAGDRQHKLGPCRLSDLRLVMLEDPHWRNLDPGTEAVCRAAIAKLEAAGATIIHDGIPALFAIAFAAGTPILLSEMIGTMREHLRQARAGVGIEALVEQIALPDVKMIWSDALAAERLFGGLAAGAMARDRPALQALLRSVLQRYRATAFIFPTTPMPACLSEPQDQATATSLGYTRNMDPGTAAGWCGISLPVGLTAGGLPVGLALEAPNGEDTALLSMAIAAEQALGVGPVLPTTS